MLFSSFFPIKNIIFFFFLLVTQFFIIYFFLEKNITWLNLFHSLNLTSVIYFICTSTFLQKKLTQFDNRILQIWNFIKNNYLCVNNTKIPLFDSFFLTYIIYIKNNYANFYLLIGDIWELFKKHKTWFFPFLRFYTYISFILYIIAWVLFFLTFFIKNIYLIIFAKSFIFIYQIIAKPLRMFKFWMKHFFKSFFYTVNFFFYNFMRLLQKIINDLFRNNTAEAQGNKKEKNFMNGHHTTDSTQWEIDCTLRKVRWGMMAGTFFYRMKALSTEVSAKMDQGENIQPDWKAEIEWTEMYYKMVNENHPCYSAYTMMLRKKNE